MNFKPMWDNVLGVRLEADDAQTSGGIVLPDSVKHKGEPWRLRVVATGPGRFADGEFVETRVEVDDVVYSPPFADFLVRLGGVEHVLVAESKLLGFEKRAEEVARAG